jgi:hypothetical protein
MLDPRYIRYMTLLLLAERERTQPVVEENETLVYAQIIRDQDVDAAA